MAQFILKRGNLASLKNLPVVDGQFIVVKDERSIYVDTNAGRIRLGDFQEFANLAALEANVNPSTSTLYYITDANVLAKFDGEKYVQINTDTGATSVEVVGDGNAVTEASYDAVSRKLTLTKGTVFATKAEHDTLAGKVNALEVTGGQANVIESVKVNGAALEVAEDKSVNIVLGELASKDIVEKSDLAASVQASLELADSAIQEHQSIEHLAVKTDVEAALALKADKTALESAVSTINGELALKAVATDVAAEIERVEGVISSNANTAATNLSNAVSSLEGQISAASSAASSALESAVSELEGSISDVDAKFADYRTSADQDVIDNGIKATMASDKEELEGKINLKVAQADFNSTVEGLNTAIAGKVAQADYNAKVAELAQDIADAEQAAKDYSDGKLSAVVEQYLTGEGAKETIDTLVEIADWINSDAAGVAQIISDVATNKQAIADEKAARELADTNINSDIDAIEAQLSGIAAGNGTVKAAIDAALQAAKDYADENDADTQYNDTEVRNLIAANTQAIANALAEAKKYADDNDADTIYNDAEVRGLISDNAGEISAIKADYLKAADKTELEGKITKASEDAASALAQVKSDLQAEIDTDVKVVADALAQAKTDISAKIDADVKVVSDALAGYISSNDAAVKKVSDDLAAYVTSNDAAVALKANAADVYTKSEVYTKGEVDSAISNAALVWVDFE